MRLLISILMASSLAGCASNQVAQSASIEQQALQQAAQLTLSPQEVLSQSAEKLQEAAIEELSFYSPRYLSHAQNAYAEAQSLINKPDSEKLALTQALESQHYVEAGLKNKAVVVESLALVLNKKSVLESLDSQNLYESGYNDAIDKVSDLIQLVEAGKMPEALEKQPGIVSEMVEVEIDTLKVIHLTDAEIMLQKAEDGDADTYAEVTFEHAEKTLANSTAFIEQHYAQRDKVEQSGTEALKAAQHAYYVAKESQLLIQIKADKAEQHILSIERLFHRIGQGFEQDDLRYMSIGDQSTVLAQQAEILGKRLKNRPTVQEKAQWEKNKQQLLDEIDELKSNLAIQPGSQPEAATDNSNSTTPQAYTLEAELEAELEAKAATTEENLSTSTNDTQPEQINAPAELANTEPDDAAVVDVVATAAEGYRTETIEIGPSNQTAVNDN